MQIIPDRQPWECPRCRRVNAPHIDQCPCDPDAGVTADMPGPAQAPPPATVPGATTPHGFWYGGGGSGGATTFSGDMITWTGGTGPGGGGGTGAGGSAGSGLVVHSHVQVDGREVARAVQAEMLRQQQRNGGIWGQRGY